MSTHEWVSYMIERLKLDMPPEAVENHIVNQMVALYRQQIPYLPGAVQAVALAAAHYTTGLASGSPRGLIDTVTSDNGLQGKFKDIVSGDQVQHGKPSPDIYLAVADMLGVDPAGCVCIEDSGNGILAGKNAGLKVIAVPDWRFSPSRQKLQQADVILDSLTDFSLKTLDQLS